MGHHDTVSRAADWTRLAVITFAASLGFATDAVGQPAQEPALVMSGATHDTTTRDIPAANASVSRCEISTDPVYGTKEHPIELGGPGHPATRETVYLSALRGPIGQGLHFARVGTVIVNDVPVDLYNVEYPGLPEPRAIYIDGYHAAPVRAPHGWICGLPLNVPGQAPVIPFASADPLLQTMRMRLAVTMGQAPVPPISLDPDGSATHGVVFDHMRLVAMAARAAAERGAPLDPVALPAAIAEPHSVIVAFPLMCRGTPIVPHAITYRGAVHTVPVVTTARGRRVSELVPGFSTPAGALAARYDAPWLFGDGVISVQYERACESASDVLTFPVLSEDGRTIELATGVAPAGVTLPAGGAIALIDVFMDAEEMPVMAAYAAGAQELTDAAFEAARRSRVRRSRTNGSPNLDFVTLPIRFPRGQP